MTVVSAGILFVALIPSLRISLLGFGYESLKLCFDAGCVVLLSGFSIGPVQSQAHL